MRSTQHPDSQDLNSQPFAWKRHIDRARHFLARAGITVSLPLLSLAVPSAAMVDTCEDAQSLTLPTTLIASAEPESAAWFSVEVEAGRFLLAEAQGAGIGSHRPQVQLFDDRCRRLKPSDISEPKRGRQVISIERNRTVLVAVRPSKGSEVFILDLWTDALGTSTGASTVARHKDGDEEPNPVPQAPIDEWDELRGGGGAEWLAKDGDGEEEPNPVPQAPIDEWDELRGGGCGLRLAKDGDGDEEPNPVPQAPIDEWDEIRTGQDRECEPVTWRELRGLGAVAVTGRTVRSRPWCEWAGRLGLLGTFSCARTVSAQAGERTTIERVLSDRPEMLALELDGAGVLDLRGVAGWTVYGATGDLVADAETEALERGFYFIQIHDPDPVYELTVLP